MIQAAFFASSLIGAMPRIACAQVDSVPLVIIEWDNLDPAARPVFLPFGAKGKDFITDVGESVQWHQALKEWLKVDASNRTGVRRKHFKHLFCNAAWDRDPKFIDNNFVLAEDGYYYAKGPSVFSVNKEFTEVLFKGQGAYSSDSESDVTVSGTLDISINAFGCYGFIRDAEVTSKQKTVPADVVPANIDQYCRWRPTGVTTRRPKTVAEHIVMEKPQCAAISGRIDQLSIFENHFTVAAGDVATRTLEWGIGQDRKVISSNAPEKGVTEFARTGTQIGSTSGEFTTVQITRTEDDVVTHAMAVMTSAEGENP